MGDIKSEIERAQSDKSDHAYWMPILDSREAEGLVRIEVARSRHLDEFHFWVLAPVENTFLWSDGGHDVDADIRAVLTAFGQTVFRRIELRRDLVDVLKPLVRGEQVEWLNKLAERYLPA